MQQPPLVLEKIGPIARLTMNRPRAMNAFDPDMLDAFGAQLSALAVDDEVRVLLLTGAGTAFCAGADLKQALASDPKPGEPDFLERTRLVLEQLAAFPKPTIAALNGITLAGGLEIALCADLIIAAETATIGDAHANFGVFPGGGGAAVLPRVLPRNAALYLLFTGKALPASALQALGLVSEVHPPDTLMDAALDLCRLIAAKSPLALRRIKEVARASADKTRGDALLHEQVMLRAHLRSADLVEGLRAFAEKRPPRFVGR